ncbi:MAG: hypothetical protein PHH08_02745 [Candidatus ainarchaeum sp.]|nr:hypothetical protein [Candidatus ainarchaeum sp.]
MRITDRGFVFSFDAAIAVLVVFSMLFLVASAVAGSTNRRIENAKSLELWKNTVFASDSLVKNNYPENPALGSAAFDAEKHRVKSNEIDLESAQKITGFENKEFFVKQVKIIFQDSGEKIIFSKKSESKNCLSVERIVLVQGKIAKIGVTGCGK